MDDENIELIGDFSAQLKQNGYIAGTKNVPVGFTVSDSGKFILKYSLSEEVKPFTSLRALMLFVIKLT